MLAALTVVMVFRDPRRMRCAVFTGVTLVAAYLTLQPYLAVWVNWMDPQFGGWYVLGLLLLSILMVFGVAAFLIWSGVVLSRREGLSLAHSLSLVLGLAIVGYIAAIISVAFARNTILVVYLLMLIGPILAFSFTLFSFLLYSGVYGFWAKHWAKPGELVVVLGSGIIGDQVTPLLGRRLDLGLEMYKKSQRVWPAPVMVVSGGKGSDEQVSEAEAMAKYVLASTGANQWDDAQGSELILEDQSTSTEQNLAFTRGIAAQRGIDGPWIVVTSDFHAFRAAMLLSKQGTSGNAVGARSAGYFWPSAKLREFVAILAANRKWTVGVGALSFLPLILMVLVQLTT